MAGGVLSLSIAKTAAEKWSDFFFTSLFRKTLVVKVFSIESIPLTYHGSGLVEYD